MQHLQDSSAANSHDDAPQPVVNKSGHADQRETDVVPDPPSSSMYPHTERRIASDNAPYTLAEFTQYYGPRIGQQMWQNAPIHEEPAPDIQCATQPAPARFETSDAPQPVVQSLVSNSTKTEATHPDSVPSSGQGNRRTVMENLPTENRLVLKSVQDIYWAPPPRDR